MWWGDDGGAAIMAAGGDEGAKGGGGEGKTYTWPRRSASTVLVMFASELDYWSDATVRRDKESLASVEFPPVGRFW